MIYKLNRLRKLSNNFIIYLMQLVNKDTSFIKGQISNNLQSQMLGEELKHFKNLTSPTKQTEYNALKDKYAFGYFQNSSVQKHLKKMLKVFSSQNSFQNMKNLPPSTENRKIIGTLSQKIMRPQCKEKIKTERVIVLKGKNKSYKSVPKLRDQSKSQIDAFFPYKEDLKLKSLQKMKQNIEKKEKLLKKAEEKGVSLPRLKTTSNDNEDYHEKTMQRLIQRQNKVLAEKMIVVNRLKRKQFSKFMNARQEKLRFDSSQIKSNSQV